VKKLVLAIALLLVVPVMLVGCGKSESAAVEDSINGFADAYNDGDYEKCTDYLVGITDANKATIADELEGLEAYVESMEVTKIEEIKVDGSSATAKVTLKVTTTAALGGQSMEQTIDLPLSKVDGKWKFTGEDIIPSTGG
jgi:ketosteroid isomerase-like protein